jgi:hypothetical protein
MAEFGSEEDMTELWKTIPEGWELDMEQSPPVLMFHRGEEVLSTVPLSADFLKEILPSLNSYFISSSEAATSWEIRYPEDPQAPAIFSLMKGGAVAASLPLTDEILATVVPTLDRFYEAPDDGDKIPRLQRLKAWIKRHKIWSVIFGLMLLPFVLFFLLAIVQGFFPGIRFPWVA